MPRYIFDVHDDAPVAWGDTSHEFAERDEIESYVRQLIEEAQQRQDGRNVANTLTTVFVHHDGDGIVLTAYGRPGTDVRFVWAPGSGQPARLVKSGSDRRA